MSDKPLWEKATANVVQHKFSLGPSKDFKIVELIKNPNISLNDSSRSNLLFNDIFAISTITRNFTMATILNNTSLKRSFSFEICCCNSLSIVCYFFSLILTWFYEVILVMCSTLILCSLNLSLTCLQCMYPSFPNKLLHLLDLKSLQQKQNAPSKCLE